MPLKLKPERLLYLGIKFMDIRKLMPAKGILLLRMSKSFLFLSLLFTGSVMASMSPAETSFMNGVKAYKKGDYQSAEQYFSGAKKQGYKDLKLDYNLGVVSYKQEKYEQAISYFNNLTSSEKYSSVAHYNIGLSLERQGKKEEAYKFYQLAANDESSEKIQNLANKKLKKTTESKAKQKKNWDIYTSVAYGYDDNVTLVAEDTASGQSDSYWQIYGRARYTTPIDARIYASIFDIQYDDLDDEDYRSLKAGIDYPFKLNQWKMTPALEYSESKLGDDDYQEITDYKLKARKRFGKNSLTLSYRYSDIDAADNQYDYLEGDRHRVRINYRMPIDIGKLRLRYQYETNDRKDTANTSYSPDRHTLEAKLAHELNDSWEVYVDGSYRYSDYPSKGGRQREDDRYRMAVGTEYEINKTWSLSAKYEYTDNHSDRSEDEYTRNVYQLSLDGKF